MAGRKGKEITIPLCPQVPDDNTTWDKDKQEYVWKPAKLEKLEEIKRKKIEKRERHARVALASYNAKKGQPEKNDATWDSGDEIKGVEALEILQKSVSEMTGVAKCLFRDTPGVCRHMNIPLNQFLWENGIIAAAGKRNIPLRDGMTITEAEFNTVFAKYHPLQNFKELSRLWELCAFEEYWKDKAFVDWLEARRKFVDPKTKWWALTEVLDMDLDPAPHAELVNFLYPWDNIGLNREYKRTEFHEHLLRINDGIHRKMVLYPRSFYKSTTVQYDLVIAQIALPDLTTIIVTATHPLSKKFVKKFRSFFTVVGRKRTLLQQLFPEFTISATEGTEHEYQNPMSRFNLVDPSVRSTSMGATNAGSHTLYQIFDDSCDEELTATLEGRESISNKRDAVAETADSPYALEMMVGTRYVGGTGLGDGTGLCPDLYGVQLNREALSPTPTIQTLIKGAWTVKHDFRNKAVIDLQENEVDLLWPSRDGKGSWKVLSGKRRANLQSFCHQQLNMPIGFAEEELHIFSKEEFERGMLAQAEIPSQARWCQFWDLSYGREDGDFSAGITVATWKDMAGLTHLAVVDGRLRKLKPSLISNEIVDFFKIHPRVDTIFIEKPMNFEDIEGYLKERSRTHLVSGVVPYKWIPRDTSKDAKTSRIKSVQAMSGHEPPTFHFVHYCGDLELMWSQFENWTAKTKSGKGDSKKDDAPDVCGIAVRTLNAAITSPAKPVAPRSDEPRNDRGQTEAEFLADHEQRMMSRDYAREMHNRIFNSTVNVNSKTQPQAAPEKPAWSKGAWGLYLKNGPANNVSGKRDRNGNLVKP